MTGREPWRDLGPERLGLEKSRGQEARSQSRAMWELGAERAPSPFHRQGNWGPKRGVVL